MRESMGFRTSDMAYLMGQRRHYVTEIEKGRNLCTKLSSRELIKRHFPEWMYYLYGVDSNKPPVNIDKNPSRSNKWYEQAAKEVLKNGNPELVESLKRDISRAYVYLKKFK